MSKNRIVAAVGIILFLMPILGFTTNQKNFFMVVFGIALIALSLSHSIKRRQTVRKMKKTRKEHISSVFVDGYGSMHAPHTEVTQEEVVQSAPKEEVVSSE